MRHVMVRYKVKEERLAEHEALIRAVFDELSRTAPPGIRYAALKQPDGLSFVHIAFVDAPTNPLETIAAFKAFTSGIRDRCSEPPVTVELTPIGRYFAAQ